MSVADYNQGVLDALKKVQELAPPAGETALESLRNIYIGERSVLARAAVQIRALLKPDEASEA